MKNEVKDGVMVIHVEGNLLGETSSAAVMELVAQNISTGNKKLLFNLADMKFINSTGLGMLLNSVTKTRAAQGEVAICNTPDQMKKLLQMTKLESVFISKTDEAEAIKFLNGVA